jgi:hypothetical protein
MYKYQGKIKNIGGAKFSFGLANIEQVGMGV